MGFTAPQQLPHHVNEDVLRHGTPFAWRNARENEEAVYLGVHAPGGFEQVSRYR